MRGSRSINFTPGLLKSLPEADWTDHSESDGNEATSSISPINMEPDFQTPRLPSHVLSRETPPSLALSPVADENNEPHGQNAFVTRVTFSPDPDGNQDLAVHTRSSSASTQVERESSTSPLVDVNKNNNNNSCATTATTTDGHPRVGHNNINNSTGQMDDDGIRPEAAPSPQAQRDPDGARPKHRIGESRRFSEDFGEMLKQQLASSDEANGGEASIPNEDAVSSPSSPPGALKEISISKVVEDVDEDEDDLDNVLSPSNSPPPVDSMSPPPAPMKPASEHSAGHETPSSRQGGQQQQQHDLGDYSPNFPYRMDPSQRPPSSIDQPPQESDLSVFSIHSGYAMHDPNGGMPPRIVPGTMVSPAAFQHAYANLPPHMQHQAALPTLQSQHTNGYTQHYAMPHAYAATARGSMPPQVIMGPPQVGKRKVHFRLVEDLPPPANRRGGMRQSFLSFRRTSRGNLMSPSPMVEEPSPQEMERGRVTVAWYEGTTTLELMEHVRNAVIRKLGLSGTTKLAELRLLDESFDPPEEIVLSPYIPNGSRLLLRFTTRDAGGDETPPYGRQAPYTGGAPDSPSAAPSPHASALDLQGLGLNPNQLALLGARLKGLQMPTIDGITSPENRRNGSSPKTSKRDAARRTKSDLSAAADKEDIDTIREESSSRHNREDDKDSDKDKDDQSSIFEMQPVPPEDEITKSLKNITELLMLERQKVFYNNPKQQKRQVVFVLANYFVLFLSLIAISAEIQARAPGWNAAIERHLTSVKNCSRDQDALFECVSNGDFSGLVASVVLWISRSAATKRIFLFGFDSPRKLWTVVYESLVTAVCWGFSYIFIRRGMNPDTNRDVLRKYWKDAVYGSLAGFNAAFMKMVLKNLIPQEAIEDMVQERQLKILSWLPSMH